VEGDPEEAGMARRKAAAAGSKRKLKLDKQTLKDLAPGRKVKGGASVVVVVRQWAPKLDSVQSGAGGSYPVSGAP
jgi:hypothetical protein